MKKFLFLVALSLTSIALGNKCPMMHHDISQKGSDPIDALIYFNDMEMHHKDDWFDLSRQLHDAKYALLKKQHDEKAHLHHHSLKALKRHGLNDRALDKKLHHMIKLHERQVEEWRRLYQKHSKISMRIYEQHKHELEAFKKSL